MKSFYFSGLAGLTEQLAAALELESSHNACDYVGHLPAAKDYCNLRTYRLRRGRTATR